MSGHNALYCSKEANPNPPKSKVAATTTKAPKVKSEVETPVEPTVSAVSHSNHGFIREYDSDELDLWTDDGQEQSAR
jgi:hypothetical protein